MLLYDIMIATNSVGSCMTISYKKLWKIKEVLWLTEGIPAKIIEKLCKTENVHTAMPVKICTALHCDIADIAEDADA